MNGGTLRPWPVGGRIGRATFGGRFCRFGGRFGGTIPGGIGGRPAIVRFGGGIRMFGGRLGGKLGGTIPGGIARFGGTNGSPAIGGRVPGFGGPWLTMRFFWNAAVVASIKLCAWSGRE